MFLVSLKKYIFLVIRKTAMFKSKLFFQMVHIITDRAGNKNRRWWCKCS